MSLLKVLIVDDYALVRQAIAASLQEQADFQTFEAESGQGALDLAFSENPEVALIDLCLRGESGADLAQNFISQFPRLAVILMTANERRVASAKRAIGENITVVSKSIDSSSLAQVIRKSISEKRLSQREKQRRAALLGETVSSKQAIRNVIKTGVQDGAERMEGITEDFFPVVWTAYHVPVGPKKNVISLASTVGCVGCCRFCRSGKKRLFRKLSVEEILGQLAHGLESCHASQTFKGRSLTVNFACEGDCLSNLENCCEAITVMSRLNIRLSFIMTTIGSIESLERFLADYSYLPVTFYWSLNFLKPGQRDFFMPGTKGLSVKRIRDLFSMIAQKTGKKVTVSWILINGVNDTDEDARLLSEFLAGGPFRVKLMNLEKNSMQGFGPSPRMDSFQKQIRKSGLACRRRPIVGGKIKAGCGTTVSEVVL